MPILTLLASALETVGIYVIRVALLLFFVGFLMAFPWPDITPYLYGLSIVISKMWFFNFAIDMPTVFAIGKIVLLWESILLSKNVVKFLINFLGSGIIAVPKDGDPIYDSKEFHDYE